MRPRPRTAVTSCCFAATLGCCTPPAPGDTDGDGTGPGSTGPAPTTGGTGSTGSASTGDLVTDGSSGGTTDGAGSGLELLVCSFVGDAVGRFDLDSGAFLGDLGPTDALDGALGIVVGPDGRIYVAGEESNSVLRFDGSTGAFIDRFIADDPATMEDETGGLSGPGAVLFGPDGRLYVSSFDSDAILRYDGTTGAFIDVFVPQGAGGLDGPDAGMVFGPDGHLYVPGYYSNSIPRYDGATGMPLGDFVMGGELDNPRTLVFHGDHMYVANEGSDEVLRYDAATGAFVDVFVAAGAGGLDGPAGMVFGPDGVLHVASVENNLIHRYDETGAALPELIDAVAGGIATPTHITLAPALL